MTHESMSDTRVVDKSKLSLLTTSLFSFVP